MRLYMKFFAMHLKRRMAYRKAFLMETLGQFFVSFTAFLSIKFLFDRFERIDGFSLSECMLCAGVMWMTFALAECFFRGFDRFPRIVRAADFDRLLVRPRGLIFQVICHEIEFSRLGRLAQAAIMLGIGVRGADVQWTLGRAALLAGMVLSGMLMFVGLFILYAAICFFTLDGLEFMNAFTDGAREFGAYPIGAYGETILKFCTYAIPYALFQYYPLLYLLSRTSDVRCALTILIAPLFCGPCCALWCVGVRKYKSAGN